MIENNEHTVSNDDLDEFRPMLFIRKDELPPNKGSYNIILQLEQLYSEKDISNKSDSRSSAERWSGFRTNVFGQSEDEPVYVLLPEDCLIFLNCLAFATVTKINSSAFQFDIQTTADARQTISPVYVAIGLSSDARMEDDSVVECVLSDNEIGVFMSYTRQGPRGADRHEYNDEIRVTHRSYTDGVIRCTFERQTHTVVNNQTFDINQLSYHLLLAIGNQVNVNSLSRHTNRTASTVPLIGPETVQEPNDDIDYNRCGKTQSCFGIPDGCIEAQNCHTAIALSYTPPNYTFQLMTSSGTRYIAVALSFDKLMADDSVIECVRENNAVDMYTSYTRVDYTGTDRHSANGVATLLNSSYTDGRINCYVQRTPFCIIDERDFDLDNQRFYIMIAIGDDATTTEILEHKERQTSSQAILLQDIVRLTQAHKPILLKLHGCFMIFAWMGTAAIGLVLARYYKGEWNSQQIFGKDIWFVGHMACMIITWALTLAGFVLIFIHVGGWTRIGQYHGIIGTIVTVLCFFQPIGAVFRPSPDHKKRYFFNIGHYFIGRITFLLAIVTIFFAIFLSPAEIPIWFIGVMVLFAIVFWGYHILMSIMLYLGDKERGLFSFLQSMVGPARRFRYDATQSAWYIRLRVKAFFIYLAVITSFVITGIFVVVLYRK